MTSFCYFHVKPVQATTTLFSDDFETRDFSKWDKGGDYPYPDHDIIQLASEGILNGGFEDGLNNWTYNQAWLYGLGHCGEEACELYYIDGWIEQTLETEIPVNSVDAFECYVDPAGTIEDPNNLTLIVTYTDEATSTHSFDDLVFSAEWQYLDLKPYLTSDKTTQKIKFIEKSATSYIALDCITMMYSSGTYLSWMNGTANDHHRCEKNVTLTSESCLHLQFHVRIDEVPIGPSDGFVYLAGLGDTTPTAEVMVVLNTTSMNFGLMTEHTATSYTESSMTATLQKWYLIDIYVIVESSVYLFVDGNQEVCRTDGEGLSDISNVMMTYGIGKGDGWSGSHIIYHDDVLVDDYNGVTQYYFNFNFYDLDSEDVELYVDWALWDSTHDIDYSEGEASLYAGTYYLKTSKYNHLINTTTLDTDTYGNSTIDINLNMKRHQSCPNGFITSNDTISSITVHAETPQLLNFTMQGTPPDQHGVGVAKNASYILEDGVNMTDWTYQSSPSHIYWAVPYEGEVLIDYHHFYTTTSDLLVVHPSETNYYSGVGQRRIPTMKGYKITRAKFELDKYGNPQGNLTAILMDADYIVKAESDSIDMSTLSTSRSLFQFNFSTEPYVPSTQYSIAVIAKDASVLDGSNYISVSCDGNGGYEGEDSCKIGFKNDRWWYTSSWDCNFYVYGQKVHNYAFVFASITDPVVGPHTPQNNRVEVNVRLNGDWVKGCNVTVEGGPDNRTEWALTGVFGSVKFYLKTGGYEIVATYEEYSKTKPVYVSTHMTIGIDLTKKDIISPDVLPKELFEDMLAWLNLPELDLTSETFLVFIIPLIVLVVYAVKKASEGPKRRWKYSYLK